MESRWKKYQPVSVSVSFSLNDGPSSKQNSLYYRSWYILINLDTMSSEAGTKQVSHFKGASPKSLESLDSACQGKRQGKRRLMVNAKFVLPASTTNNLRIPITNFFAPQWFQFFIRVFSARDLRKIRLLRFAWPWNHAAGCCDGGRSGKPQGPKPRLGRSEVTLDAWETVKCLDSAQKGPLEQAKCWCFMVFYPMWLGYVCLNRWEFYGILSILRIWRNPCTTAGSLHKSTCRLVSHSPWRLAPKDFPKIAKGDMPC